MQSLNIVFCWASVLHLIFNRFFVTDHIMARFLKLSVTSTSSDGLIAVNSTEPAPSQNVSQPEIAPNTTDASMPSHEATEQFSDRDSVLVECELNSRDGANGSAASTSKQAGDVCVAITPNCWCPCTILCSL